MKTADDYDEAEKMRQIEEPKRKNDKRSPFERDRSRIIHSASFRRLQAKTQVFGTGGSDFFRTRLTHSLEVTQIAKGLALNLQCADTDLVEAICLAHDIGHPPFGHIGEEKLQELMSECGGFDSNAQNLRILSEIEIKSKDYKGLNLTRSTIDGLLKYKKSYNQIKKELEPPKKFYYDADHELVKWASENNNERSIECDIMDWADEIAYSIHDLEDGIKANMISVRTLENIEFREKVKKRLEEDGIKLEETDWAYAKQMIEKATYDATIEHYRKAYRKTATAQMINYFISGTGIKHERNQAPTRYHYDLVIPDEIKNRCRLFKAIVWETIINDEKIVTLERKAKKIIEVLFNEFTDWESKDTENMFPNDFRETIVKLNTDEEKRRVACDYIAGMTDVHAIKIYSRLVGTELSPIFEML